MQDPAGRAIVSACPLVRSAGKTSWLEFQPVAAKGKENVKALLWKTQNGEDSIALQPKIPTIASNLFPFTVDTPIGNSSSVAQCSAVQCSDFSTVSLSTRSTSAWEAYPT